MLVLTTLALATTVDFAGRTWNVRAGAGGPGPNHWSDAADAVWVDGDGALHLTIRAEADGTWSCTEVWLDTPTTFGTHTFYVDSRFDAADPNVVLGLFTYQDDTHEIDIELARWGDRSPGAPTLWYTVQPPDASSQWSTTPTLNGSYTTHQFDWQPGSVHFRSWHGHTAEPPEASWVFGEYTTTAAHVPTADAAMPVHLNLWLLEGRAPTNGREVEVVIRGVDLPDEPPADTGDTAAPNDTGAAGDSGPADTAPPTDTTSPTDTATSPADSASVDSGGSPGSPAPPGCGCGTGPEPSGLLVGLAGLTLGRRARRRP